MEFLLLIKNLLPVEWALLAARLIVGVVLIYYGWPKIKDLRSNAEDFAEMGLRPGWLWGTPIALLEFVGGILFIAGVLVRLVALAVAFEMITGTLWKITQKVPFTDYSYDLLLLALGIVLFALGGGAFTLLAL